jgi:hypothetical protein
MTFPADVAGVALIDSATPYQFDLPDYPGFYSMWRRASAALPSLARLGLLRLLNTGGTLPADAQRAASNFASSPRGYGPTGSSSASFPRSSGRPRR